MPLQQEKQKPQQHLPSAQEQPQQHGPSKNDPDPPVDFCAMPEIEEEEEEEEEEEQLIRVQRQKQVITNA